MTNGCRAHLVDESPLESVPLRSPAPVSWTDPRTNTVFKGYLVDVDALTDGELRAVYAEMKSRLPDCPPFPAWVSIIRDQGMPIREERVSSVSMPLRGFV